MIRRVFSSAASLAAIATMAAMAALLAACTTGRPSSSALPTVYDFGLPVTTSAESTGAKAASVATSIAIEMRTPPWFESTGVDYRLAYDDPFKRHEYTASRWSANPGVLLAQRLRQQLGLADAASGAAVVCRLRIELQEFSQIFDSPLRSRGVIQAHAMLVDAGRRRIADRQFAVERAALTPDARGGVGALVEAGDELGQQLATWLHDLDGASRTSLCRPLETKAGRRNR